MVIRKIVVVFLVVTVLSGCSGKNNEIESNDGFLLPVVPEADLSDLADESAISEFDYARMVRDESQDLLNVFQRFKTLTDTRDYTQNWRDRQMEVLDELETIGGNLTRLKAPTKYREMDQYLKQAGEHLSVGAYYYREGLTRLDNQLTDEGIIKMVEGGEALAQFNNLFVNSFTQDTSQDLISEQVLNSIVALSKSSYEKKAYGLAQEVIKRTLDLISICERTGRADSHEALALSVELLNIVESIEILVPYYENAEIDVILKHGARDIRLGTNYVVDTYKNGNNSLDKAMQYLEKGYNTIRQTIPVLNGGISSEQEVAFDVSSIKEYKENLLAAMNNILLKLEVLNEQLISDSEMPLDAITAVREALENSLEITPVDGGGTIYDKLKICIEDYSSALDMLEAAQENQEITSEQINELFSAAKISYEAVIDAINNDV